MIFTRGLIQKAYAIRRNAAERFNVPVSEIHWGECLKWAEEMSRIIFQAFIKATIQRLSLMTPTGELIDMECKSLANKYGTTRRIVKFLKVEGKRKKAIQTKILSNWDMIDYADFFLVNMTESDTNQTTLF